jgi:hypothetical protein
MIEGNSNSVEISLVARGRRFLEQGDVSSAVACYGQVFDPDAVDEPEARSMLIEGRSHLSRKHLAEALDAFEEALMMGTEVQRRQALDGIAMVGEVRSRLAPLTTELKKILKDAFKKRPLASVGMALVSDSENVVLLSGEVVVGLPVHLARSVRITRLPQHLIDHPLPFKADRCVPYTDQDDVRFVREVAHCISDGREQSVGTG